MMPDAVIITIILLAALVLIMLLFPKWRRREKTQQPLPPAYRALLEQHVRFYQRLNADRQKEFENRVQNFLSSVRITGIKTEVSELDRVLVGASAIIPIFEF